MGLWSFMGGCGSLDDMLDAEEKLSEQLESLPCLVRFQYDKSRWASGGRGVFF
jgi:hypothetical protein